MLLSCLFGNFVVQMCSACAEARAEEDLGFPGERKSRQSQTAATSIDPKKDLSDAVKKPIGKL